MVWRKKSSNQLIKIKKKRCELYPKNGREGAEPVLREEERVGQRLVRPKLSIQNAPTKGRRRRIVGDETSDEALVQSVEAIL